MEKVEPVDLDWWSLARLVRNYLPTLSIITGIANQKAPFGNKAIGSAVWKINRLRVLIGRFTRIQNYRIRFQVLACPTFPRRAEWSRRQSRAHPLHLRYKPICMATGEPNKLFN